MTTENRLIAEINRAKNLNRELSHVEICESEVRSLAARVHKEVSWLKGPPFVIEDVERELRAGTVRLMGVPVRVKERAENTGTDRGTSAPTGHHT